MNQPKGNHSIYKKKMEKNKMLMNIFIYGWVRFSHWKLQNIAEILKTKGLIKWEVFFVF